jgi:hypothetical protein
MSAKKMLVVTLAKTKAVLAAATHTAGSLPAVGDLVGDGLLARMNDSEAVVTVPPEELAVTEVDYSDDVFHDPRAHSLDASGTVVVPQNRISSINATSAKVTVTVQALPAADKAVLVVIDAGANHDPLKFVGKTALSVAGTDVAISGVPPGSHLVLASVDGYTSILALGSF